MGPLPVPHPNPFPTRPQHSTSRSVPRIPPRFSSGHQTPPKSPRSTLPSQSPPPLHLRYCKICKKIKIIP